MRLCRKKYTSVSDEFVGIKRLNVFKFFEDTNMLLPIETFHDETTNTVYTKTDRMGTYCLVDMEIFLDNLDKELNGVSAETEVEDSEAMSQNLIDNEEYSCYTVSVKEAAARSNNAKDKDHFDVSFVIDEVNYSDEELKEICEKIRTVSEQIWEMSTDVTVRVFGVNRENSNCYMTYGRADNVSALDSALGKVSHKKYNGSIVLSKAIDNINKTHDKSRDEYCFVFFNSNGVHYQSEEDSKATLRLIKNQGTNINISVCSDISQTALDVYEQEYDKSEYTAPYAILLYKNTSGKYLKDDMDPNNFTTKVIEHIYNRYVYRAIIATGYKFVELNSDLQSNYNMYIQSCNEHADIPSISLFDTDEDGLNDYDEIMFKNNNTWLVDNSNEDDVQLYKYEQIIDVLCGENSEKYDIQNNMFYVLNGLERYCYESGENPEKPECIGTLFECSIMPINSNPANKDSDGDKVDDNKDAYPLIPYLIISSCVFNADYNHSADKHAFLPIYQSNDDFYNVCINCGEKFVMPEIEDEMLLSDQEFALVNAIYRVIDYICEKPECEKLTYNHAESLYKIIDDIRSSKTSSDNSLYDYSYIDENGHTHYMSQLNYLITDSKYKKHKIIVTEHQTTRLKEYMDLQIEAFVSYGIEFAMCNFIPFEIYPIAMMLNNDLISKDAIENKKILGILSADQLLQSIFDKEYSLINRMKLVERIDISGDFFKDWNPKNLKLTAGLNKATDLIGIGNTLTVYNYLKSVKSIDNAINSSKYSEKMFNICIEIMDENLGTTIFSVMIDYDTRNAVKQHEMMIAYDDSCYINPDSANTYIIVNNSFKKMGIDGKHKIIE